ncbi:MAG: hypothetical protein HY675_21450 [Chloroflexi bacterium]|nr:hypothetical protein [Chloroflexota bacterium]
MSTQYEVLSPWAEVDPVPMRGISPRLANLADKKIGLFANTKGVAPPMLGFVEQKLRARFPTLEFSLFLFKHTHEVTETEEKAGFEEWVKGLDAIITAVGD